MLVAAEAATQLQSLVQERNGNDGECHGTYLSSPVPLTADTSSVYASRTVALEVPHRLLTHDASPSLTMEPGHRFMPSSWPT